MSDETKPAEVFEAAPEDAASATASTAAGAKKGGNAIYVAIIAVQATLLLIILGLFVLGRIVILPPGAQTHRGGGPGRSGMQFELAPPGSGPPSEERLKELEEEGATIRRLPDGGVIVTK